MISSDKNILFNKVTIDNNETFVNMINAKGNMEVSDEFVVTKNKSGQKLMVAEGQVIFNNNVVITKNKSEKEILEVANLETKGKSIIKENIAKSSIISSKTVELKGETVIEDNIFGQDGDSAVIYVLEDTFKVAILSNIKNSRTNNTWLYKNSSKW